MARKRYSPSESPQARTRSRTSTLRNTPITVTDGFILGLLGHPSVLSKFPEFRKYTTSFESPSCKACREERESMLKEAKMTLVSLSDTRMEELRRALGMPFGQKFVLSDEDYRKEIGLLP